MTDADTDNSVPDGEKRTKLRRAVRESRVVSVLARDGQRGTTLRRVFQESRFVGTGHKERVRIDTHRLLRTSRTGAQLVWLWNHLIRLNRFVWSSRTVQAGWRLGTIRRRHLIGLLGALVLARLAVETATGTVPVVVVGHLVALAIVAGIWIRLRDVS